MKIIALVICLAFISTVAAFAVKIGEIKVQHNGIFLYNPKEPDITTFRASWIVPSDPPTRNDQNLAAWIGLQPEDSKVVLQSVLQWGRWANGGGPYWNLACWTAIIRKTDNEVLHKSTKLTRVPSGQKVTGVIELVSVSGGTYTYRCRFEGYPDSEMTYQTTDKFNTAMLEYESQDITTCNDHSENVNFSDVQIMAGNRNLSSRWQKAPIEDFAQCGMKIRMPRNDTVSVGSR